MILKLISFLLQFLGDVMEKNAYCDEKLKGC